MRASPKKVRWDDPQCMGAAMHAEFGLGERFSAENTGLTRSQVRYRANKVFGIRRSDYRNGQSIGARKVLQNARAWVGYELEQKLRSITGS